MAEPQTEEKTPRRRAPLRKSAPRRVQPDAPPQHGVVKEGWLRYHDFYNGFMPHPSEFARGEESAADMGLVRIPALIFYVPIYYIFLLVLFPLFYPFMLIAAISSRKSAPPKQD